MITIRQDHLPSGHRVRPGTKLKATSLTIHSTGNAGSTAKNERAWLTNSSNNRDASWHLCVDEYEVVEAIPLNEVAWHAGSGNSSSLSIEICESGNRAVVLERAAELAAAVLRQHGLTPKDLKRHYDWTGKSCPGILMANNWADWKKLVERITYFYNQKAALSYGTQQTPNKGIVTADTLNVRSTPEIKSGNVVKVLEKDAKVTILGQNGDFYKITEGYVSKAYVKAYSEAAAAQPAKEGLTILLNGQKTVVDGMIVEGRTYIQMRELCEMIGLKVGYNGYPTIDTK